MGAVLHAAEGLLGKLRTKEMLPSKGVITALLECISACDVWVASIAGSWTLPPDADATWITPIRGGAAFVMRDRTIPLI